MLNLPHLDATSVTVYRAHVAHPSATEEQLCAMLGVPLDELRRAQRQLETLNLLRPAPNGLWVAVHPETASDLLLSEAERVLIEQRTAMASARARLDALTGDYLDALRDRPVNRGVESVEGQEELRAVIEELTLGCRSSVDAMVRISDQADRELLPEMQLDLAMLAGRVRVRTLMQRSGPGNLGAKYLRAISTAGAQVKSLTVLPACMLVFDGATAVLPLGPGGAPGHGVVIRDPAVLQLLTELFEQHWEQASDVADLATATSDAGPTDMERAVLRMMAAGKKDEVIARQVGVSTRSISRVIAALMQRLQADNRFQAGVHATANGWLA
ncbi:LuxR C-terminal-related transcriptional regulator [Streptacidiphilus fuscans]|uniref:LuxR family transcriptional regulator n=1 Tax=Streptacidiphilus fuscans TaxID=2789292 RepID=A0A931BH08_9ACTN|nr:LuxR C-terminal-related transcriptional regulator [Streptacidiphilus fuscans]MBF9073290.1 LuxR family transcriptional regulator [Streptacidiphilus fuscans]